MFGFYIIRYFIAYCYCDLNYFQTAETLQLSMTSMMHRIVKSRVRDIDESSYNNILLDGFEFESRLLRELQNNSKIVIQSRFDATYSSVAVGKPIDVYMNELHVKPFNDEGEIFPKITTKSKNIGSVAEHDPTILWLPKMKIFPTVDAIITSGVKEVFFLSITTSKSHSLVLKCLKCKDPNRGARTNRRAPLTYSGLLPLILAMKKNGFKMEFIFEFLKFNLF